MPLASGLVRLWPPKKYLCTNTPPQSSKVSAIKPAAGSHRTQGGMGVEPTVKVSQAPIASWLQERSKLHRPGARPRASHYQSQRSYRGDLNRFGGARSFQFGRASAPR
jgi:hypothetical protein